MLNKIRTATDNDGPAKRGKHVRRHMRSNGHVTYQRAGTTREIENGVTNRKQCREALPKSMVGARPLYRDVVDLLRRICERRQSKRTRFSRPVRNVPVVLL